MAIRPNYAPSGISLDTPTRRALRPTSCSAARSWTPRQPHFLRRRVMSSADFSSLGCETILRHMDIREASLILRDRPCVLFLGSGLSIPSPASLPTAGWIVEMFVRRIGDSVLPSSVLDELIARWPLPEFVYGVCERYFGSRVYRVWAALEMWRTHPRLKPNAGHLAAVHAAARHGQPLLSPNFDGYFEAAAMAQGIPVVTTIARPGQRFSPRDPRVGELSLWKLHGTARDLSSVFSSVRTLTAPISGLTEAITNLSHSGARLMLGGYSGRDLDLFPKLSPFDPAAAIWVDIAFPPEHRSRFLAAAPETVLGSFDDIGRTYGALVGGPLARLISTTARAASTVATRRDSASLMLEVQKHIENVASSCANSQARRLVLAELLINAGMASEANDLLECAGFRGALEAERVRLSAKAFWERGRFLDAKYAALQRTPKSRAENATLEFAVAVAEVRLAVPPRGLPGTRNPSRLKMLRLLCSAGISLLRFDALYKRAGSVDEPLRTPLVEGYLEGDVPWRGGVSRTPCRSVV
jgi:hypothetical protein